jgi:hypothetical protein
MNAHITRTVAASFLALCAPAAALAAGDPIQLNAAQISESSGQKNAFAYPGIVTVSFTNTNPVSATDIVFAVRGNKGRYIDAFEDVGTYAQGQAVRHTFTGVLTGNDSEQNKVEVEKATFADGSVWLQPVPSAPVLRRQSTH